MKKSRRGMIGFLSSSLSPEARAVCERIAKMPPLPVPPTVHECAAQGLLPSGLPAERTSMSPAHTRELVERYPGLYRHADDKPVSSSAPFAREGFACGDGWFSIIECLSAKLVVDPNLVVGQLKEKMGLLTVYFDTTKLASPEVEAATDAAFREAREESRRVCEVCGEPGKREKRDHHVSTLCASCEWLDEAEEACRRLTNCIEGMDLLAFTSDGPRLDAARRGVQHIGEAASHQSPARRTQFPTIDWRRLDSLRSLTSAARVLAMSAAEVWTFANEEAPIIAKALR